MKQGTRKKIVTICLFLFFFVCRGQVFAHGVGLTLESITPEGYKTYIDANTLVPYQNEPTRLDFEIWNAEGKPMEFTDMWVRIEKERATIFAGPLARARFGLTGFTTVFPFAGEYNVYARFENGEKTITETSFTLPVAGENAGVRSDASRFLLTGLSGFILGALGMYAFCSMRKKFLRPHI